MRKFTAVLVMGKSGLRPFFRQCLASAGKRRDFCQLLHCRLFCRRSGTLLALALAITMSTGTAHAYIGPGLGAGVIGTILGILGSIFLALGAVLYYPFKRFMRRRREAREMANQDRR
jgi:hypothetical protein